MGTGVSPKRIDTRNVILNCYLLDNSTVKHIIDFLYSVFKEQFFGLSTSGDNEIRTRDPLLARQVLSQLSYTPINLAATYLPIPLPI